jgi:hypothetical protein
MTIVSDATTWSVPYDCHSDGHPNIFIIQATDDSVTAELDKRRVGQMSFGQMSIGQKTCGLLNGQNQFNLHFFLRNRMDLDDSSRPQTSNEDKSAATFCRQVAVLVPVVFYFVKNHRIAKNRCSREKLSTVGSTHG